MKRFLYQMLKYWNDCTAIRKNKIGRRVGRRVAGKATGRVFRGMFG